MADNHSSSTQSDVTFKPFSWLSEDAQRIPLASLATKTFDIAQGIGLIMEMLEDVQLSEGEEGRGPILNRGQSGVLQRMIIASADCLQSEAHHAIDWLNEHGVKHYTPKKLAAHVNARA